MFVMQCMYVVPVNSKLFRNFIIFIFIILDVQIPIPVTKRHIKMHHVMHLSVLSRWRGRPGKGGGFDSNHPPVVGFFDRFNGLSSNILLTFSCYFDNPQCPGVGHLNGNFKLSSYAPPMPSLPHQQLNIDRCIRAILNC